MDSSREGLCLGFALLVEFGLLSSTAVMPCLYALYAQTVLLEQCACTRSASLSHLETRLSFYLVCYPGGSAALAQLAYGITPRDTYAFPGTPG